MSEQLVATPEGRLCSQSRETKLLINFCLSFTRDRCFGYVSTSSAKYDFDDSN
jgi:hypothetical protein